MGHTQIRRPRRHLLTDGVPTVLRRAAFHRAFRRKCMFNGRIYMPKMQKPVETNCASFPDGPI